MPVRVRLQSHDPLARCEICMGLEARASAESSHRAPERDRFFMPYPPQEQPRVRSRPLSRHLELGRRSTREIERDLRAERLGRGPAGSAFEHHHHRPPECFCAPVPPKPSSLRGAGAFPKSGQQGPSNERISADPSGTSPNSLDRIGITHDEQPARDHSTAPCPASSSDGREK